MNPFILQTAKDYSLNYELVNEVYLKYGIPKMYEVLEAILNDKNNSK